MTKHAKVLIWVGLILVFLAAVIAPLSHLRIGVPGSSFFPGSARAAERSPGQVLHPAIADPANITPQRAQEIYQSIRDQVRANYARSGDPLFLEYQTWKRFSRLPYRSPNHGERFVNHYVNHLGGGYSKYEKAGAMPTGTIVIKDSFTVTGHGQVQTGPLFLMEKMPVGFKSLAGTWRFMMLRPDGSTVGMTGGVNESAVKFCAECHANAGAAQDFLYFMPEQARLK